MAQEGKSPFEGGTYDRLKRVLFEEIFPSCGSAFPRKIPGHGCLSLSLSPIVQDLSIIPWALRGQEFLTIDYGKGPPGVKF